VELGKHVVDKELLDRDGLRGGKVDDLVLEIAAPTDGELPPPRVVALVSGPFALARNLPRPLRWAACVVYRLLGIVDPRPVEIPWARITAIDVVVHVDLDREAAGLTALQDAVARRLIGRLPGA